MKVCPEIESLIPYKPGQPLEETQRKLGFREIIQLASNENPLGPSPRGFGIFGKTQCELGKIPGPRSFSLEGKVVPGLECGQGPYPCG